jgi:hypothetical protein
VDIEFDAIRAQLGRQLERFKGILRRVAGGAPVGDDQGGGPYQTKVHSVDKYAIVLSRNLLADQALPDI